MKKIIFLLLFAPLSILGQNVSKEGNIVSEDSLWQTRSLTKRHYVLYSNGVYNIGNIEFDLKQKCFIIPEDGAYKISVSVSCKKGGRGANMITYINHNICMPLFCTASTGMMDDRTKGFIDCPLLGIKDALKKGDKVGFVTQFDVNEYMISIERLSDIECVRPFPIKGTIQDMDRVLNETTVDVVKFTQAETPIEINMFKLKVGIYKISHKSKERVLYVTQDGSVLHYMKNRDEWYLNGEKVTQWNN